MYFANEVGYGFLSFALSAYEMFGPGDVKAGYDRRVMIVAMIYYGLSVSNTCYIMATTRGRSPAPPRTPNDIKKRGTRDAANDESGAAEATTDKEEAELRADATESHAEA